VKWKNTYSISINLLFASKLISAKVRKCNQLSISSKEDLITLPNILEYKLNEFFSIAFVVSQTEKAIGGSQ